MPKVTYAILPRLSHVAGVFDVRKPYFNLDPDPIYRELGTVRHRGIELSLAGQPIQGLSLVPGAVFLNADVVALHPKQKFPAAPAARNRP